MSVHHTQVRECSAVTCDIESLKDAERLTLRARVTDRWGHSSTQRQREDFIALYGQEALNPECYGIAKFDIGRLMTACEVVKKPLRRSFKVVYMELWQDQGYVEREFAHRFRRLANPDTGNGYAVELVNFVCRPVHMTPRW